MASPVMMKGNKLGIRLIISPDASISQVQACLAEKLEKNSQYYADIKPISVTFEGKNLTEDEKKEIIETLLEKGVCVSTSQAHTTPVKKKKTKRNNNFIQYDKCGLFYIGNLKNGQSIQASASIVIVGDVESGASVESEGNIIVIGTLHGFAASGCKGRPDTFVYSLK